MAEELQPAPFQEESAAPQPPVRKKRRALRRILMLALVLALALTAVNFRGLYNLARFGVHTLRSPVDRDGDLIDDYTDIMLAARRYVASRPEYVSTYFGGGYPPDGQGVCTDVIWRALKAAGYDLKSMVDEDISRHASLYPLPDGKPDSNIDFRRVVNLKVFFDRHCPSLTCDPSKIDQWQPGDIVVYEGHVAIVSDRRNAKGRAWVIHHTGHGAFEEDALEYKKILGHYRWALNPSS